MESENTANPARICVQKILRKRKNITYMKLPPQIYQKFIY